MACLFKQRSFLFKALVIVLSAINVLTWSRTGYTLFPIEIGNAVIISSSSYLIILPGLIVSLIMQKDNYIQELFYLSLGCALHLISGTAALRFTVNSVVNSENIMIIVLLLSSGAFMLIDTLYTLLKVFQSNKEEPLGRAENRAEEIVVGA